MIFANPFSEMFWIVYFCCGISDFLDGFVARALTQQSDFGAKLDSAADCAFFLAVCYIAILNIKFPPWLWTMGAMIFIIRIISYIIGYYKYRTFTALHTYLNKIAGIFIFALPILYALLGVKWMGVVICLVAFISAIEELIITITSKELHLNQKSIIK